MSNDRHDPRSDVQTPPAPAIEARPAAGDAHSTASEPLSTRGEAIFAALWLAGFLILQHFLAPWLDSLSPYAEYVFELAFNALSLVFFSEGRFRIRFAPKPMTLAQLALSLIFGVMTYKVASMHEVVIPFDLENPTMVFTLVAIAPVLEELLFRQAMWFTIETAAARLSRGRAWIPWIATSLLFSLAHFEAYFSAPAEYHPFILYQTGYALAIGLWWGRVLLDTGSVGLTISLHLLFNFGFYLGSVI